MTGCQSIRGYAETLPKPTVAVVGSRLTDLNLDSATLVFDVKIDNPYDAALPLVNLDYSLASGGKPFLTGNAPVQGSIPAKGSSVIPLPARLDFPRLLTALDGVRVGAVIPYDAKLTLSVDAPVVGRLQLPLEKSGQIPVPAIPIIELTDVEWKGLDLTRSQANLHVKVINTNQFPLDLNKLSIALDLAGHTIASTAIDQTAGIAPGEQGLLEIPIVFSRQDLGLSVFQVLQGKGSKYKISGLLTVNTPFGPLNIPYEKTGDTIFRSR
jgi:LEA14-like dessication related protein